MKSWIAWRNILLKAMRTYYLKPPNMTWGILFPLVWTGMFFVKSGEGLGSVRELLPGVVALSILFGSTSVLAITVTFEKKARSFERLLLAKTSGAILFGTVGAFVPVLMAAFVADLTGIGWPAFIAATFLIAVASTFLGLLIAVAVSEVFEAQTFSNFFRFPMMFLCGLFIPLDHLPDLLRPLSYALPLTYGTDILHGAVAGTATMPMPLSFVALAGFYALLFWASLWQVRRRWIV